MISRRPRVASPDQRARPRPALAPARCALSSRVVLRSRRRHPSLGPQHARAHHVRLVGPRRACRARPRGAIEVALVERVPSRATGVRRAESSGVVGRRGRRHHRQRRRRLDRGGAPRALRQEGDRAGVALRHRRCRARVPARNGRRGVSIRHRPVVLRRPHHHQRAEPPRGASRAPGRAVGDGKVRPAGHVPRGEGQARPEEARRPVLAGGRGPALLAGGR